MPFVDANARPGQAIALCRRALAERENTGTEYFAIARQREFAFERPRIGDTQFFVQIHRPTYTTDEIIMPKPVTTNASPIIWLKRAVAESFSIVIRMPSPAIQT